MLAIKSAVYIERRYICNFKVPRNDFHKIEQNNGAIYIDFETFIRSIFQYDGWETL